MEQLLNPATLVLLIPIVAIVGGIIVKLRKMELQHSGTKGNEDVHNLQKEVASLRRRIEHLEAIAASDEPDTTTFSINNMEGEENTTADSANNKLKNMLR